MVYQYLSVSVRLYRIHPKMTDNNFSLIDRKGKGKATGIGTIHEIDKDYISSEDEDFHGESSSSDEVDSEESCFTEDDSNTELEKLGSTSKADISESGDEIAELIQDAIDGDIEFQEGYFRNNSSKRPHRFNDTQMDQVFKRAYQETTTSSSSTSILQTTSLSNDNNKQSNQQDN